MHLAGSMLRLELILLWDDGRTTAGCRTFPSKASVGKYMEVSFRLLILPFVCCGWCIYSIQHTPIDMFLFFSK